MLSIITAIIGFAGGFIPDILKLLKQKRDNEHELALLDKQIRMQEIIHTQRLEEINTEADIRESEALYKSSELKPSGVMWVDAALYFYNGTVRPSVAYAFVGLYAITKYAQLQLAFAANMDKWQAIEKVYTEYDQATLTLVLGYYFGQRSAAKVFKLK